MIWIFQSWTNAERSISLKYDIISAGTAENGRPKDLRSVALKKATMVRAPRARFIDSTVGPGIYASFAYQNSCTVITQPWCKENPYNDKTVMSAAPVRGSRRITSQRAAHRSSLHVYAI